MLTTLISAVVMLQGGMTCPVAGDSANENTKAAMDYAGNRYTLCCAGCNAPFAKEPAKFAKPQEGKFIAFSLFDPVSGEKIELKTRNKLKTAEFESVRYYFATEANQTQFKADPKAFTKMPEKEALYCSVMKHGINSYAEAGGYVDFEGVRYYSCCPKCLVAFKAEPAKFAANAAAANAIQAPKAMKVK
jgi:YHS domain-containing protein